MMAPSCMVTFHWLQLKLAMQSGCRGWCRESKVLPFLYSCLQQVPCFFGPGIKQASHLRRGIVHYRQKLPQCQDQYRPVGVDDDVFFPSRSLALRSFCPQ
ncbi:hypothetical protein F5Y01DRAFT_125846 [Xylaria sp. FL0043]|nr:hypothetical protein F5Y01DRAFT_125846 [Xylaria sp. FL0043]